MMSNGGLQHSRGDEVLKGQRYEEVRGEDEFVMAARREKAWPPRWMGHDTNERQR